jgi:hypothetical protein
MAQTAFRNTVLMGRSIVIATLFAMAGCAETPTIKSIEGLSASGTVSITEDFVVGWGGGSGLLNYQGQNYPFKFVCTVIGPGTGGLAGVDRVVGPGGGLSKIIASGEVYKLANVGDFSGRYTQAPAPEMCGCTTVLA